MRLFPQRLFDREFRREWKQFVFQAMVAGMSIAVAATLLRTLQDLVIVASIGSSAFLIFSLPTRVVCNPRHVIGGHLVGVLVGVLCFHIDDLIHFPALLYGVAVAGAFVLMAATETDHPPAAGTALGVAVSGISWEGAFGVLASCVMLSLLHFALRRHLRNLRREATEGDQGAPSVSKKVVDQDESSTL